LRTNDSNCSKLIEVESTLTMFFVIHEMRSRIKPIIIKWLGRISLREDLTQLELELWWAANYLLISFFLPAKKRGDKVHFGPIAMKTLRSPLMNLSSKILYCLLFIVRVVRKNIS